MANNKVTLHRVMTASPEKIFWAFSNEDAISSWLPPYGFTAKVHRMDFKVGGSYKMSFTAVGFREEAISFFELGLKPEGVLGALTENSAR